MASHHPTLQDPPQYALRGSPRFLPLFRKQTNKQTGKRVEFLTPCCLSLYLGNSMFNSLKPG